MLRIRVSDYEYEQLRLESERQGVSMSDVVRKFISKLPEPRKILTVVKTT